MRDLSLLEKLVAVCLYLLLFALVFSIITGIYSWLGLHDFKFFISVLIVLLMSRNNDETK
ncbi:hypothetical protein KNV24_gp04 [Enterococcus phage AE4_17]|uniref:Uncharacterized protein n=1 Tax=Enterococcus phage AE4_17 TaxID=2759198 RepID=A0A7L7SHG8_9CAUD|nr:hypothetical protein KNV24_gp04 [Enterococcus phage AE4_17]QNR52515.1 hypothetical protein [Enterococcus phage ZEF1]QOC55059.1 hypothetical protein [Enterococcus phage AE4_17]